MRDYSTRKLAGAALALLTALLSSQCRPKDNSKLDASVDLSISPAEAVLGYGIRSFEETRLRNNCLKNIDGSSIVNGQNDAKLLARLDINDSGSWTVFSKEVSEKLELSDALDLSFQANLASKGLQESATIPGALARAKVALINRAEFRAKHSYTLIRIQFSRVEAAVDPDKLMIEDEYLAKYDPAPTNTSPSDSSPGAKTSDKSAAPQGENAPQANHRDGAAAAIGRLLKDCGDMYLESYTVGGEFIGLIETETATAKEDNTKEFNGEAKANILMANIDASGEVHKVISKLNDRAVSKVWIAQIGGCFLGTNHKDCETSKKNSASPLSPPAPAIAPAPTDPWALPAATPAPATRTVEEAAGITAASDGPNLVTIEELNKKAENFISTIESRPVMLTGHFESYDRYFRKGGGIFPNSTPEDIMAGYERQFSENHSKLSGALGESFMNLLVLRQLVEKATKLRIKSIAASELPVGVIDQFNSASKYQQNEYESFIDKLWHDCYLKFENCVLKESDRIPDPADEYQALLEWVKLEEVRTSFYQVGSHPRIEVQKPHLRTETEFNNPKQKVCIDQSEVPQFSFSQAQIVDSTLFARIVKAAEDDKEFNAKTSCFWIRLKNREARKFMPSTGKIEKASPPRTKTVKVGIWDKGKEVLIEDRCYEVCGILPLSY